MSQHQKPHWVVSIPATIPDLNTFKELRPSHVGHLKALLDRGIIVFSGPTLKEHPKSADQAPTITGTVLVIKADTQEEVRQHARENPFAKAGIWDVDAASVQPYILALRS